VYSTEQPPTVTQLCTPPSSHLLSLNCVLHQAATYCHSTVYCTKITVMLNYSGMPSVATGCWKKICSFLVENATQTSL